ncbi:NAD(+) diphosphatase [Sphingomonas morindae]|uniref:NAD(+) diphosphatase n=1 Tax=Sphingomonas morindae TaxID=1541170 RepID=A0ABY4X598_9SPHN|nr:NAD(+) diphosphatase [Sphingomonas morindae]USI72041.1 NAD(+) diphosphatase [Sphingomonas morindae]
MFDAPGFTGAPLDRCDAARHDPALVAAMRADPEARLLALDGLEPLVEDGRLGWLPVPQEDGVALALLGRSEGRPRFAALTPGVSAYKRSPELMALLLDELPAGDAALYGVARSLIDWHARHGFCAQCGHATEVLRAGWARACPACGAQHFPRVDPVVIMIAEHDGRALLGRQPGFPPGRYSALAGFVEPGESIEEAVARELNEEAGITVEAIRYVASQPWPFPAQLMIACTATARDDALRIDTHELEDAFWASRDEVRAALAGAPDARFQPPPAYAIAHLLVRRWAG